MKQTNAWAIIDPKGKILVETIRLKLGSCVDDFLESRESVEGAWQNFQKRGYSVRKVKVEVET